MARTLSPAHSGTKRASLPRRILWRIATERTTPARLAWAVGIGILIGTTPFFGFHLLICLTVATVLGLNRAVTYLAANISVPWIAPFLIFGSIQLGTLALDGHWLALSFDAFGAIDPVDFGKAWLVGSIWLGSALGMPAGLITFFAVRSFRRRHPLPPDPIGEAIERVCERYLPQGRWVWGYVRGKLRHDPVYRQLAERAPLRAPLVDVGCGRGQCTLLLLEMQPGLEARGLDFDPDKLERGRQAAAQSPERLVSFDLASSESIELDAAGTILMIDVLHYSPAADQDDILRRAARALLPGGTLYVRDIDDARGWRSGMTRWQERIGRWIGFNRGATLCFRDATALTGVLEEEGLDVEVVPSWGDTPLANVLIVATRPEPDSDSDPDSRS